MEMIQREALQSGGQLRLIAESGSKCRIFHVVGVVVVLKATFAGGAILGGGIAALGLGSATSAVDIDDNRGIGNAFLVQDHAWLVIVFP